MFPIIDLLGQACAAVAAVEQPDRDRHVLLQLFPERRGVLAGAHILEIALGRRVALAIGGLERRGVQRRHTGEQAGIVHGEALGRGAARP